MKILEKSIVLACVLLTQHVIAQRIKLIEGNLSPLKSEKSINVEFGYDNMRVGKFGNEADYISSKKSEYNRKESGKGDAWAKSWVDDRHFRYEPKFNDLFGRYSDLSNSPNSKYTLIFKTIYTEPGFNIGISRRNAEINAEAWVVETANRSNVLSKISIERAPGRTYFGNDYDTGERIAEAYADAGKGLGKFIKDKSR